MQSYAATYSGHAKIDRLMFIADRSQGTARELEALKVAAAELKKVSAGGTGWECAQCVGRWWGGCVGGGGWRGLVVQRRPTWYEAGPKLALEIRCPSREAWVHRVVYMCYPFVAWVS